MVYRTTPKMLQRKLAHRDGLLKTAIALFGRHGYHATTVPMIVKAAGSSTGSFYLHFKNKEDVFAAALQAFGERVADAINAAIAAAGENRVKQMRAAVESFVMLLAENPHEARILIVESSGLGRGMETVRRKLVDSHARSVAEAISSVKKAGLSSSNAELIAHCWVGSVYESVYHWLESPMRERPPAERVARAVADFNLRGIGAL